MEFGKLPENELELIDFKLPPDPAVNKEVLAKGKGKTKFYIGCAKWGRKDWVGKLYPVGTKEKDFLEAYAKHFNSIEFNALFYRMPTREQVMDWKSKVGADFKFCPKFPDTITHIRRLKNCQKETEQFLQVLDWFGEKLGSVFLMPHPQMGLKHFDTIKAYIASLPQDINLFVELRHPEWFEKEASEQIFELFEKSKVGSVITDTAGRRDCLHMHLSTPETFIRFVGNSLDPSDYSRIDAWVKRLKEWKSKGLQRCYFFMHQHDELYSPELSVYLIEALNRECGLNLQVPQLIKNGSVAADKNQIAKKAAPKKALLPGTSGTKTAAKKKTSRK